MRYTLFVLSFLILSFANAQKPGGVGEGTIFGKIIDDKNSNPVEYVAIRLLKAKDSSIVTGVFSDADGKFNLDRKSTRLNSSHITISYAVFCLKKKKITNHDLRETN